MGLALKKEGITFEGAANENPFGERNAELHSLELERRLRKLNLTLSEYRDRVAVKLCGNKVGVTSNNELDTLLNLAPHNILDDLESLWDLQDGKFRGWKMQSGHSIDKIKRFVLSHL